MSSKIKFIIAFPKSAKYYGYYINNNLEDKHLMDRDDFYFFIAELITVPLPTKVREFIDRNREFLVNIEKNEIYELQYKHQEDTKNLRQEKLPQIMKKKRKEQKEQENEKNKFYDKNLEKIQKKFRIP